MFLKSDRSVRAKPGPRTLSRGVEPGSDVSASVRRWKHEVGYHRRSLVETAISRAKRIIGPGLSARELAGQRATVRLRCAALNRMTGLGMPDSYPVDADA